MRVNVISELNKEERQVWEFNLFDLNLVLVGYRYEKKPKGKRKWRSEYFWDIYNERGSTMKERPVLVGSIRRRALKQVQKLIRVLTWKEWKRE